MMSALTCSSNLKIIPVNSGALSTPVALALSEYNTPVLRLAEMYLIRAEALLEGASVSGETALNDYNAIRTNRGLADATSVSLNDIYAERRRELCFEGNELFDLARTQRSLFQNRFYRPCKQGCSLYSRWLSFS